LFLSWRKRRRNVSASRRRDKEDANKTLQILHIVVVVPEFVLKDKKYRV
jgi:hypothetical protein